MITLVHGDDLQRIEKEVLDVHSKVKVNTIDGSKIKLKDLESQMLGLGLFEDESVFIIESVFKNKLKKEIVAFIDAQSDLNVMIVERKKIAKKDVSSFKFKKVIEHSLPQYYFKFLDDFYPKNSKNLSIYYKELSKTFEAEQIFYSMIKRVRALLALKKNINSYSEIKNLAPWQKSKLVMQSKMWDEKRLKDFYTVLFDTEKKMKTNNLPLELKEYLDIVIFTELN